jgi:hypothetical protein
MLPFQPQCRPQQERKHGHSGEKKQVSRGQPAKESERGKNRQTGGRISRPQIGLAAAISLEGLAPGLQLRDENGRLKKLVVDLSLDKEMLKAVIAKNGWSS